jgi:hypothetical protein
MNWSRDSIVWNFVNIVKIFVRETAPCYKFPQQSEEDTKLAQKLGQLQPIIALFPQECMGQLSSFGPA